MELGKIMVVDEIRIYANYSAFIWKRKAIRW